MEHEGNDGMSVVRARNVDVVFRTRRNGRKIQVHALNGVSIDVGENETVGLVGESGSGKSTLARALMKLIPLENGEIELMGEDVTRTSRGGFRAARSQIQMVFQDPYSSLDPSMTVGVSIEEPLKVHTGMTAAERRARVADLLVAVGLTPDIAERYPDEFSGGQRQRVAIARAIASRPQVVVCDEAVSALDVSTQNQILSLLEELKRENGLSLLFISHDLAVVRYISDRVVVMYLGSIIEEGPADRVYSACAHPYTESLLAAAPIPDPEIQKARSSAALVGDLPDPSDVPAGCAFHTRCRYAMDICRTERPQATAVDGGGSVACHLQTSGPELGGRPLLDLRPVGRETSEASE